MRRVATGIAALLLVVVCLNVGFTAAAFSAKSSNPANTVSAAANFCVDGGTVVVNANRATYVDAAAPNSAPGATSTVWVKTKTLLIGETRRRTLVHFELPAIPAHCDLSDAKLKLAVSGGNFTSGRTLTASRLTGSWSEGSVTWNNQPGSADPVSTASGSGTRQWDVDTAVGAMYSGSNNGFIVFDANENQLLNLGSPQQFQGRNQGSPPQLELTFS